MTQSIDGWTLTIISISVVFLALLILFGVYSLSGAIFCGKLKKKRPTVCDAGNEEEIAAAVSAALELYFKEQNSSQNPGVITIRRIDSDWSRKDMNFRKLQ